MGWGARARAAAVAARREAGRAAAERRASSSREAEGAGQLMAALERKVASLESAAAEKGAARAA